MTDYIRILPTPEEIVNALFAEHVPEGVMLLHRSPEQRARPGHPWEWTASLVGSGHGCHGADKPLDALAKALDGRQLEL